MATIVLSFAGAALGGLIGGPIGAIIGRAAGAIAGNVLDQALLAPKGRRIEGARLNDLRVMGSSEGQAVPRLWGRARVAGQVIWATKFEEVATTRKTGGGKGLGGGSKTKVTEYTYFANFAVALCEGEVARIGRVWADGKLFDLEGVTWRLHTGREDQLPDSLIVAKEGAGLAPAYRDTAYLVFERLPLERFGNRLPQLSFEVFRGIGGIEGLIKAVNIIPAASEFGYDTDVVTRSSPGGVSETENGHVSAKRSDWQFSIDELEAVCPNLAAASLAVAWFGDDLRCGQCTIRPKVETAAKTTVPHAWGAAGLTRASAGVVSQVGGKPAYGGTPSDGSVRRAIADLKARGLKVTFHPFVMMDIAAGNTLTDPYTGAAGQPVYPWRGRITCDPAPGRAGTPDKTAALTAQASAFIGTAQPTDFSVSGGEVVYSGPAEWSLRRMVLHYAKLCSQVGGVDTFLIGSELRGLTTLRNSATNYPAVDALAQLAADVKSILPAAKVSYGADWSEYFGHQPQDGSNDVFFHLDPLWSASAVDFIGIDNYMPLADWRDGRAHLDAALYPSTYDAAYLASNISGGEGYDWYYASDAARLAQTRTAIGDGAYGKPWVFRYKDLKSWWENAHYDRPGGVESAVATAWVAKSKPIRFTEAGCPAVDKGANQPNVFYDAKSSESALPYFSSGATDGFIQHQVIRALSDYWLAPGAHNPVSPSYGGTMVEADAIHWWSWDARPFPAFPALTDVWADGGNYGRGHWLNGRAGAVSIEGLVKAICNDYGFDETQTAGLEGIVDGALAERVTSARGLIEPIAKAFAFDAVESGDAIHFRGRRQFAATALDRDELVEARAQKPLFELTRAQETELPTAVKLAYVEGALDYRVAAVEARKLVGASLRETVVDLPCIADQALAQQRAEVLLQETWAGRETIDFVLPPRFAALEPGDVVDLDLGTRAHLLRIEAVNDALGRKITARRFDPGVYDAPEAPKRGLLANVPAPIGQAAHSMLDLPLAGEGIVAHQPWIAGTATPWPGRLLLLRKSGPAAFTLSRSIEARATMGELVDPLPMGPLWVFDRASKARVRLYSGALSSVSEEELLGGENAAAVGDDVSGYEIIQFRDAVLTAPSTYEISWLLRGQSGSEIEMRALPAGARFVLLDPAVVQVDLGTEAIGQSLTWRIGPQGLDHGDPAYVEFSDTALGLGLRPLRLAHLKVKADGGDAVFNWIRRTRIDGDGWELPDVPLGEESEAYELDVMNGAAVARTIAASAPTCRYTAAEQVADFGAAQTSFSVRVAQLGTAYGRGPVLEKTLNV
jgi:hypothetical protein